MEVIYIWCDGEVGKCDEEDRRKLDALAGHNTRKPNSENKVKKLEPEETEVNLNCRQQPEKVHCDDGKI